MASREQQGNTNAYHLDALLTANSQLWLTKDTTQALKEIDTALEKYPLDSLHVLNREYYPFAITLAGSAQEGSLLAYPGAGFDTQIQARAFRI